VYGYFDYAGYSKADALDEQLKNNVFSYQFIRIEYHRARSIYEERISYARADLSGEDVVGVNSDLSGDTATNSVQFVGIIKR
jgi:hypothetical protein